MKRRANQRWKVPSPRKTANRCRTDARRLSIETLEKRQLLSVSAVADAYEPDNIASDATVISTDGVPQAHSLETADIDWVKFTIAEATAATVRTDGAEGDTRLWLYGPDDSTMEIAFNDDADDGSYFSSITADLEPGTYYAKVDEFDGEAIDSYSIAVVTDLVSPDVYESDDNAAEASPITTDGTPQQHSIHTGGDEDWVTFSLAATATVTVETGGESGDTQLWLFGPDDSTIEIAYNDDANEDTFFAGVTVDLTPGVYYAKASEFSDSDTIANYTISVLVNDFAADAFEIDDTQAQASEITTDGTEQLHSLHADTDVDWVWFAVTEPSLVEIQTAGSSGDTTLALHGPDGASTELATDDNGGDGSFSRLREYLLPGTYHIKVATPGPLCQSYALSVTATPVHLDALEADDTPEQASPISTDGTTQLHSIHVPADVDWVTFTLAEPARVTLKTEGMSGDTRMTLFGPDNWTDQLQEDDNGGDGSFSRIDRTLQAGRYYAKVEQSGNVDTIDDYSIRVSATPFVADAFEVDDAPEQASDIATDGSTQTHSLHTISDADWLRFTVGESSLVTVETTGPFGDTLVELFGPDDSSLAVAVDDDGGEGLFSRIVEAVQPGTYYAKISTPGDLCQSYDVSVTATPLQLDIYEQDDSPDQAAAIPIDGTAQEHSIHVMTDTDWVTFTLVETMTTTIETSGSSGDTRLELFGPGGWQDLLDSDDDSGTGAFSRIDRVLAAGTYFVKVDEYGNDDTIDLYTLAVTTNGPCDLSIESFEVTAPAGLVGGRVVIAEWSVKNLGPDATVPRSHSGWEEHLYWSEDDQLDAGDLLVGIREASNSSLAPGQEYAVTYYIGLPQEFVWSENGQFLLAVNADQAQLETDLSNNVQAAAPTFDSALVVGVDVVETSITIEFDEPMAIEPMIADGSILAAISLVDIWRGPVSFVPDSFAYDNTTNTLAIVLVNPLRDGYYDLRLEGEQLRGSDGGVLRGGTSGIAFQVGDFGAEQHVQAGAADLQVDSYSVPCFQDFNGDEISDLLVGERTATGEGKIRVYLNQGTNETPTFDQYSYVQTPSGDLTVAGSDVLGVYPRLFDWNGDGLDDLALGLSDGTIELWANVNTSSSPVFDLPSPLQVGPANGKSNFDVGALTSFDVVDWNNDGRSDLVVGGLDGGVHVLLDAAATGIADFPMALTVQDSNHDLIVPTGRAGVAVADLNNDGRKDLLVGNAEGQLILYPNVGSDVDPAYCGSEATTAEGVTIDLPDAPTAMPWLADFNGDGIVDALVGSQDGFVRLYLGQANVAPTRNPIDNAGVPGDVFQHSFEVAIPTADAGGPYLVEEGATVTLDATSSTVGHLQYPIVSYAWDFDGDGQYNDATGTAPTFSAAEMDGPSSRIVSLQVTDESGGTDSAAVEVTIQNQPPTVDAGGPYEATEGGTVVLNGSATDPAGELDTLTFEWDFDRDGQYDDAIGETVSFSAAGLDGPASRTASLRVTDDDDASHTADVSITVVNAAPCADAGGPYTVAEGGTISLDASGSTDAGGDALTYEWDLDGNGQYDDAIGISLDFSAVGMDGPSSVTIGLRVTDDDGASSTTMLDVEVMNSPPIANLGGPYTVVEGGSVLLDASGSTDPADDTLTYAWDLDNDGQYDDANGVQPTFSAAGLDGPSTVTVGLKVVDDDGAADTTTVQISVTNVAPTADAGGPYSMLDGGTILLNAAASTDPGDDIAAYRWDLDGDGTYDSSGKMVTFSTDQTGTHNVAVLVTDKDGASNTATTEVTVSYSIPTDLGTITFNQVDGVYPATGNCWYQVTAGRTGLLTVMATSASGTASVDLYSTNRTAPPLASSTGTAGTQRLDHAVDVDETYLVRLSGTSSDVDLTFVNLVNTSETEIQVFGTDGADAFEFAPSASYLVTINGVAYQFDDSQYETIVFAGGLGDDTAHLSGGPNTDIGRFWPDHGTFGENDFLVTVNDVTTMTAHGGGGADSAYLYDSPGDDQFYTLMGYGRMTGVGFTLETFDFMYNYGYATTRDGGNDVAYMEDTSGADKFKFDWPKPGQFFGKMYGGGIYYNRAKNFEQIEAVMTDGKNRVRLFDSEGDDALFAQKDSSRMTGPGFDVTVSGYSTLAAYASTGFDIAHLEDSDADDTTRARPHKITLWGGEDADPTYEIMARRFDEYHFQGKHGGFDRAKLHDTVLNDHVIAAGNSASLYTNDEELDLLYEVTAFEWVKLYGTDNDAQDTLEKEETLDFALIYDPAIWEEMP